MNELRFYLLAKYEMDSTVTLHSLMNLAKKDKLFDEVKRKKEVLATPKRWKTALVGSIVRKEWPKAFPVGGGIPLPFYHMFFCPSVH
jgi:hypothetical protein